MLLRKNASTSGRHIGANGLTAAKLISLRFILIVRRQLFLLCLLLREKASFHCSLGRIGFCFQQFFEPVDIRLDDPSQIENSRSAAYCRLRWPRCRGVCFMTDITNQDNKGDPFHTDVCYGSLADMTTLRHDVRFTPRADIRPHQSNVRFTPRTCAPKQKDRLAAASPKIPSSLLAYLRQHY
jgi:hypothetical protein